MNEEAEGLELSEEPAVGRKADETALVYVR